MKRDLKHDMVNTANHLRFCIEENFYHGSPDELDLIYELEQELGKLSEKVRGHRLARSGELGIASPAPSDSRPKKQP